MFDLMLIELGKVNIGYLQMLTYRSIECLWVGMFKPLKNHN